MLFFCVICISGGAGMLAEMDGLNRPQAYGEIPLFENDPTRPNEKYFKHVDFIVNEAEILKLIGLGLLLGVITNYAATPLG